MHVKLTLIILSSLFLLSCNNGSSDPDAYGNFEAEEISVGADVAGRIIQLELIEGSQIEKGQTLGLIDTMQLSLKIMQVDAMISAIKQKLPNEASQLAVFDERLDKISTEINRLETLVEADAAPSKQLDDLLAEFKVVERQKAAAASTLSTQTRGMLSEIEPLKIQKLQLEDQKKKCSIVAPISGTVLGIQLRKGEFAAPGRGIFTMASLNPLILKAFIGESQLSEIKLGQTIQVSIDGVDSMKQMNGSVSWISDEAEFTPKMIQTKEERTAQVYAFKVNVINDGSLKIGMPAEVHLSKK